MKHLFLALPVLLAACSPSGTETEKRYHGFTQGTTFHITYRAREDFSADSGVDSLLLAVDRSMSTWIPSSLISRLNRGETVTVDSSFLRVWEMSKTIHRSSSGAFDPTVGTLVNLWGFGQQGPQLLTEARVDSALRFVGMDKVSRKGLNFRLQPGVKMDFNAIAQGYTVDLICEWLETKGVSSYMVEVGGEVRTKGKNAKGEAWRIGIDKPTDEELDNRFQVIAGLSGQALATSGNYRKYWVDSIRGIKYSHTIDPTTGYPVRDRLLSVSIVAPTAMEADGYATACLVMGLEKAQRFLLGHPELEGYLIYTDEKGEWAVWQTAGFKEISLN